MDARRRVIESYLVQISMLNHIAQTKLVRPVWHTSQTGPSLVWLSKGIWRQTLRVPLHQELGKVFLEQGNDKKRKTCPR
jgi:hypothetical protein